MDNTIPIESIRRFSIGAAFWGILGLTSLVAGLILGNMHLIYLSLAPWLLATGLCFFRPADFRGELTDDRLRLDRFPREIAYEDMQNLTLAGKTQDPDDPGLKAGPLIVTHKRGVLEIPASLDPPVKELYRALWAKLPKSGSRRVAGELTAHLKNEETIFGSDHVYTFVARNFLGFGPSTRRGQACSGLMMLCGLIWILLAALHPVGKQQFEYMPWIFAGVFLILFGLLSWIILVSKERRSNDMKSTLQNASLIISPSGIALIQEDLKGFLRWDELKNANVTNKPKFSDVSIGKKRGGGDLLLKVSGAEIRIADVYDCPLAMIKKIIDRYWKGNR
ncbi:MAG: hypothetical protein ABSE63_14010 [Thermoguttaceae bacterium]|jgi:hypothetical protein